MPGFLGDPIGNPALQAEGAENVSSGVFGGLPGWFSTLHDVVRSVGNFGAEYGITGPDGVQVAPPEPSIPADAANQQFGSPGAPELGVSPLKFTTALPASVARSLYAAKQADIIRADAAARSTPGFLAGAARMGADLVQQATDPLNLASAFVPGIGEARVGGLLAKAGLDVGEGFVGSTAARLAAGFTQGVAGQAGLSALRYGISQQEQGDYSFADAAADTLMGGLMGGGLHAVIGGVGDLIGHHFAASPEAAAANADPLVQEAASRAAVAQMVDGRPVDVPGAIQVMATDRAVNDVADLARVQRGLGADPATPLSGAVDPTGALDRAATLSAAAGRIDTDSGLLGEDGAPIRPAPDLSAMPAADAIDQLAADRDNAAAAFAKSNTAREAANPIDPAAVAVARAAEAVPALEHPALADERPPTLDEAEMAALETQMRTLAGSQSRRLDAAWLRSVGGEAQRPLHDSSVATPYNAAIGKQVLAREVDAALSRRDTVTLHHNGEEIPIVGTGDGALSASNADTLRDATGRLWNADAITGDATGRNHVEVHSTQGDPDIAEALAQSDASAKEYEASARAFEAAANCMMARAA